MTTAQPDTLNDVQQLERLGHAVQHLRGQVAQRIVGQEEAVDGIVAAILAGGHALLIGVPGLAKTLMVSTVASALDLSFHRIQFTPDLMPSDITGTEIIEEDLSSGKRAFRFVHGPVFANVVLADEINRTPPKTQAALLQAMQEHEVTVGGTTYELRVGYPSKAEEEAIVEQTTGSREINIEPVLDAETLLAMQGLVRRIPVSAELIRSAVTLARITRPDDAEAPGVVKEYVEWGAGPRASQYLILGAKARAAMNGRPMADLDDVRDVAGSVLRHRVVTNFAAEAAGRSRGDVVQELLDGKIWLR
jgi:MoxR-like ATPase